MGQEHKKKRKGGNRKIQIQTFKTRRPERRKQERNGEKERQREKKEHRKSGRQRKNGEEMKNLKGEEGRESCVDK